MIYVVTYWSFDNLTKLESRFHYQYQAQQLADRLGFRFIDMRSEREEGCTCIDFDSESHANCKLHGISAQLDRTQME